MNAIQNAINDLTSTEQKEICQNELDALQAKLARLESALADLQQFKDNAVNNYVKLQDFAQSLPRELRRQYFKPGGYLVDGVIALAAVTGEDAPKKLIPPIRIEITDDGTDGGRSVYRLIYTGDPDGESDLGNHAIIPVEEWEDLNEAAREVVNNWEHGDLAGAVNELRLLVFDEDANQGGE